MTESTEPKKVWTESTRPGTAYQVFKHHMKNEYNKCGDKPVYVRPVIPVNLNILKYQQGVNPFQTPIEEST